MGDVEGVSLREFGRELGISGEAIRKAIKTGRIPAEAVGSKVLRSGRPVPVIVNPELARKGFKANTDQAFQRPSEAISAGRRGLPPPEPEQPPQPPAESASTLPTLADSRAKAEMYKAELARLEYEEKAGLLVDAAAFRLKYGSLVKTACNRILAVPSKVKGRIPHLTLEDVDMIRSLLREALEEVARGG